MKSAPEKDISAIDLFILSSFWGMKMMWIS